MEKKMKPKDKAEQLIQNMLQHIHQFTGGQEAHSILLAKDLAIDCVKEIWKGVDADFHAHPETPSLSERYWNTVKEYYDEVINEITHFNHPHIK